MVTISANCCEFRQSRPKQKTKRANQGNPIGPRTGQTLDFALRFSALHFPLGSIGRPVTVAFENHSPPFGGTGKSLQQFWDLVKSHFRLRRTPFAKPGCSITVIASGAWQSRGRSKGVSAAWVSSRGCPGGDRQGLAIPRDAVLKYAYAEQPPTKNLSAEESQRRGTRKTAEAAHIPTRCRIIRLIDRTFSLSIYRPKSLDNNEMTCSPGPRMPLPHPGSHRPHNLDHRPEHRPREPPG